MRSLQLISSLAFVAMLAGCDGNSGLSVASPDARSTGLSQSAPDAGSTQPPATVSDAGSGATPLSIDCGVPYPTTNIGGRPGSGGQPGQIFPNLTLQGIRSSASLDTQTTVSFSEYFDPQGQRFDLLHVMGIFMWCPHCDNETKAVSNIAAWQSAHRVAAVQIAMSGYGSDPATWSDLRKWITDHNLTIPVLLDAKGVQLGQYFQVGAVPVNIVVNPRTMEILAVDIGEVGDVQSYEQKFLSSL
jgi:hypothetical protein